MRMWMIPPELMCQKHRVGEHGEIHKHRHNFLKHHSIAGRISPIVQIEPQSMKKRHDELAVTLKNHNSPYELPDLSYLPLEHRFATVNGFESLRELCKRCPDCRKLIEESLTIEQINNHFAKLSDEELENNLSAAGWKQK